MIICVYHDVSIMMLCIAYEVTVMIICVYHEVTIMVLNMAYEVTIMMLCIAYEVTIMMLCRWNEVMRKMELWVEIDELNYKGEWSAVEVQPKLDIPSAGQFQLQQVSTGEVNPH